MPGAPGCTHTFAMQEQLGVSYRRGPSPGLPKHLHTRTRGGRRYLSRASPCSTVIPRPESRHGRPAGTPEEQPVRHLDDRANATTPFKTARPRQRSDTETHCRANGRANVSKWWRRWPPAGMNSVDALKRSMAGLT